MHWRMSLQTSNIDVGDPDNVVLLRLSEVPVTILKSVWLEIA